ncbi:MAG: ATP-binding cassette domain-containing protein [bacterium]|nr:ATP-binding cassette domain-containing protein [bacterium]
MNPNDQLLIVKKVKKYFPVTQGVFSKTVGQVKAVDGVSFEMKPGETLGLVGESGCGKTTLGRVILQLYRATEGEIRFKDSPNLVTLSNREIRPYRRKMQMIFQDPFSSLNPRMTIGSIVGEGLTVYNLAKGKKKQERIAELLNAVGINPDHMYRYPHEFSGGQRQRIGIARALAVEPELIIADEPVSSLDVSIQAQIINLLQDLQLQFKLSFLLIAHDLAVVEHISDRVAVMYLGKIVEMSTKTKLYKSPLHPYTKALLSAVPIPDPKVKVERILLPGDIPSPMKIPTGCRFHTRCPIAQFPICKEQEPELLEKQLNHFVACHFASV